MYQVAKKLKRLNWTLSLGVNVLFAISSKNLIATPKQKKKHLHVKGKLISQPTPRLNTWHYRLIKQ